MFLADLYVKDFEFYKVYTELLLMYLSANPNNLSKTEIIENTTTISAINAMFMVRDREQYERDLIQHHHLQSFIDNLTKKEKP